MAPVVETVRDTDDTLLRAQKAHREGETRAAERLYRQIIRDSPGHPIANNNLAALLIDSDRAGEAEVILFSTISRYPDYADAIANMAACQGQLAKWRHCLTWCKRSIRMNRDNPMPHLWKARAEGARSGQNEAIKILRRAITSSAVQAKDPLITELILICLQEGMHGDALREIKKHYNRLSCKDKLLREIFDLSERTGKTRHFFRAIRAVSRRSGGHAEINFWLAKHLLSAEGHTQEKQAIELLLDTVKRNPQHSDAWLELAIILRKQNNIAKSVACLHRSIKENPKNLTARIELVNTHLQQSETREAIRQSARARQQFPNQIEALTTHCHALISGDRWNTALRLITSFKQSHPGKVDRSIVNCEGAAYTRAGQYAKAITVFRDALLTFGQDAAIWNNRGMAYGLANRPRPEIQCYRRAIALQPEDPGSHVNLAMAMLAHGDYMGGLKEYEWRLKDKKGSLNAKVNGPLIEPGEDPGHLLVVTEQGLGDTLQFARYLHDLRARLPHSTITLACPEKLSGLLSSSLSCVDNVVSCEKGGPDFEAVPYLPLMSIPYFCGIHPHESCAPAAYLQVDIARVGKARTVLREGDSAGKLVIGLNWKGNPLTERTNLKGRSMTLHALRELVDLLPDAVFVSLQKGAGSEELESCIFRDRFIKNQSLISADWCFMNTSAYILACDYIVTTDTSIAHLSGALGKATHLLLAHKPEWRWCGSDNNSRWYPSMSLSRQIISGNWRHPLREVASKIQQSRLATHVVQPLEAR